MDAARRLRRKAQFEQLLRQGTRRSVGGYVFYLNRRESGPPALGILISRKHSAKAVERNRIKRCIREAFRLAQERLGPIDLLIRPPYGVKASREMVSQLQTLMGALK